MSKTVFSTMGASNHSLVDREENDFYATEPRAIDLLFEVESFDGKIWEPFAGMGHLSNRMKDFGVDVYTSDLIDRSYDNFQLDSQLDFFMLQELPQEDIKNIITNPSYKMAQQAVEHSMDLLPIGGKCAMFLKVLFLESKKRKIMFNRFPPKKIYVSSSRLNCARGGDFVTHKSSAIAYAWYIWEKGYKGETVLDWIN